jgi:Uma2 family endonuclease
MTSIEALAKLAGDQANPAWEVALLYPEQGAWTEGAYLRLTNQTNRLVELVDGRVEVLPMPSRTHQKITAFLYRLFYAFVEANNLGTLLFAPLRVRLWSGRYREPDLVFVLAEHAHLEGEAYFSGADLVIEVVSPDDPDRDLVDKRADYAEVGITEYWIVNPLDETVTVLRPDGKQYTEHGVFQRGVTATSVLLAGVEVDVDALFDMT